LVSIDTIERKVCQAEDKAWKVIEKFGLPRLHGPSLADLEDHAQFRHASDKDKRRIVDARNVLISAHEVRDRLARGDIAGALNYARYLEQDPGLLEDARRGAKTRKSASEGGRARAVANQADQQNRWDEWRRKAKGIWSRRSELSASAVANQIAKGTDYKPDTIRRRISDLRPLQK
jgi:hypothetical protein